MTCRVGNSSHSLSARVSDHTDFGGALLERVSLRPDRAQDPLLSQGLDRDRGWCALLFCLFAVVGVAVCRSVGWLVGCSFFLISLFIRLDEIDFSLGVVVLAMRFFIVGCSS